MFNASRNSISHKHLPLAQADSSVWRPRGWQRGSWAGDPWHIRIAAHREKYPCVCPASSVSALHGEQQHPEICPKPGMRGQAAQRGALQAVCSAGPCLYPTLFLSKTTKTGGTRSSSLGRCTLGQDLLARCRTRGWRAVCMHVCVCVRALPLSKNSAFSVK